MIRVFVVILVCLSLVLAVQNNLHQGTIIAPEEWKQSAVNEELISSLSSKKMTWKAGVNSFFSNVTRAQAKRLLGFKINPETRAKGLPIVAKKLSSLPVNYDASRANPGCPTIGTIYNQAECGSCWAFGCVESASDRLCIQSKGKMTDLLSFSDEVSCGPDNGCEGGDPYDAWNYVASSGLVTNACYPYTIPTCPPQQQPCLNFVDTPACDQNCVDGEVWNTSKHIFATAYAVATDSTAIQTEIYENGPVEACFSVYEDFLAYKSGVYQQNSGSFLGGHCIKIIGWGVEDGTPYWLCNNSWTTYWGDEGQFKILRGSDECGIEDQVVAGSLY